MVADSSCSPDPRPCVGGRPFNGESNALQQVDNYPKPIRVIDLRRTITSSSKAGSIYFNAPVGWDFHVLSHTWSLPVRGLSQKIGKAIKGAAASDQLDAANYNRAFMETDFREDPCYQQLLDFFQLLQMGDGVEEIWFDALCINQHDEEEKSHEISNMAQFYSLSKGCYVLPHGVGEGYQLWSEGARGSELPRWFTRVWTFQEFLLPRRLCFIVEGVDERLVALVNRLIKAKSKIGLCRCFLEIMQQQIDLEIEKNISSSDDDLKWMGGFELRKENWKSIVELMDERTESEKWRVGPARPREPSACCNGSYNHKTDKLYRHNIISSQNSSQRRLDSAEDQEIISSHDVCHQCHSHPMIRKAKKPNIVASPTIYFVDREAYLALMQCESRMIEGPAHQLQPTQGIQALRGLYCALAMEGNWRACHVICEVGYRACSNEEDRVLSILGFLGLRRLQLRTQKSLLEQVVELVKAGGSHMLIELCMMNDHGGKDVGFSWAPSFHGANRKLEFVLRPAQVEVEVQWHQLKEDGHLKLKAKIACGTIVPIHNVQTDVLRSTEASHCLVLAHSPHQDVVASPAPDRAAAPTLIPLNLKIDQSNQLLTFEFSNHIVMGSFQLPINVNARRRAHLSEHSLSQVSFHVRLVLLGKDERMSKMILVCIVNENTKPMELHKIGSIAFKEETGMELQRVFSESLQECVIGGFGADLTEYVFLN